MRRHQRLVIMVAMYLIGMAGNYHPVEAAFDENLTEYSLGTVVVTADQTKYISSCSI